jgi:hypothetical protein
MLFAVVVLCVPDAAGQGAAPAQDSQTKNAALREKAFELLESVAGQLSTLQSAENRARLGANVADSIWDHDEKRARALFVSIQDDIKTGQQSAEVLDDPFEGVDGRFRVNRDEERVRTRMVFVNLRFNIVERIARHDPELALSFLKATEPADSPRNSDIRWMTRRLELNLSKSIAARNPELALKLGRKILQEGLESDLFALLRQLNRKHRPQAQELYADIVQKLRDVDLAQDPAAFYFAQTLGRSFKPPAADESAFRELIGVFNNSASSHGCGGKMSDDDEMAFFCSQLHSLITQMQKNDASRVARSRPGEDPEESTWVPEAYEELSEVAESGTIEEILALATKYPQLQDEAPMRALWKAQESGDYEQARRIANDYVRNPELKARVLAELDRGQTLNSMSSEKLLEEQQKIIDRLPDVKDKARMLVYLAGNVGVKDRKLALKLLNQASGMIDSLKPGKDQLEAQLVLAMMYCLEKSDRGFEIMETMMPKLNELISATAKLDGYDNHTLRDGEWNMSNEGVTGEMLTVMAQNSSYFAWCDLDRAVGLAAQFERPEIRLMAQLKLAQGILAGPPAPLRVYPVVLTR